MVSHDQKTWHVTILIDLAELDLGDILQFWDPNQHFGERMTENLDQTLHTDTAKTVRPAASPWVLLVLFLSNVGPKKGASDTFGSKSKIDLGQRIIQIL